MVTRGNSSVKWAIKAKCLTGIDAAKKTAAKSPDIEAALIVSLSAKLDRVLAPDFIPERVACERDEKIWLS